MLDKLRGIEDRFAELERKLSDPSIIANNREFAAIARERSQIAELVARSREYRKLSDEMAEHKSLLEGDDQDLRELARNEMPAMAKRHQALEEQIRKLLVPRDPND